MTPATPIIIVCLILAGCSAPTLRININQQYRKATIRPATQTPPKTTRPARPGRGRPEKPDA
jgi:hypothetical protein